MVRLKKIMFKSSTEPRPEPWSQHCEGDEKERQNYQGSATATPLGQTTRRTAKLIFSLNVFFFPLPFYFLSSSND